MNKWIIAAVASLVALGLFLFFSFKNDAANVEDISDNVQDCLGAIECESNTELVQEYAIESNSHMPRLLPTRQYSLLELEHLGRVPDDANERTWRLCESTSWWGNRLDPDQFWSNRIVWLSQEADNEAHRSGRGFPPIPRSGRAFLDRSDKDESNPVTTWESRNRAYYSSERENAFWDWFQKNKPRPPEDIDSAVWAASEEWAVIEKRELIQPTGLKIPSSSKETERSWLAERYVSLGFPVEAFSREALKWEYIRCKRLERDNLLREQGIGATDLDLERFYKGLDCPRELVESEPSIEELRITKGWRIAYLRRLVREGTDESYIEAYKKAWNLSEDDLREDAE